MTTLPELPPVPDEIVIGEDADGGAMYGQDEDALRAWAIAYAELAVSSAAAAIPAGWKLVPIKPTEPMHIAAVRTIRKCRGNADFPPRVYAAMLAAAPAAPVSTVDHDKNANEEAPSKYSIPALNQEILNAADELLAALNAMKG